jgi:hypothetical protein
MATDYSGEDLLEFLNHAAERGLMPAATARALAVATRRVLESLTDQERADVRQLDLGVVIKRFVNKRAKDFNPSSLREYGRRFQRAVDLFRQWRENPATFSVRTRATAPARKRAKGATSVSSELPSLGDFQTATAVPGPTSGVTPSGYQSSFPIRPGTVVTIVNIPPDLSKTEAERLAQFVRMLALD